MQSPIVFADKTLSLEKRQGDIEVGSIDGKKHKFTLKDNSLGYYKDSGYQLFSNTTLDKNSGYTLKNNTYPIRFDSLGFLSKTKVKDYPEGEDLYGYQGLKDESFTGPEILKLKRIRKNSPRKYIDYESEIYAKDFGAIYEDQYHNTASFDCSDYENVYINFHADTYNLDVSYYYRTYYSYYSGYNYYSRRNEEYIRIQWYDGSNWSTVKTVMYDNNGAYTVHIPDEKLSDNNMIRIYVEGDEGDYYTRNHRYYYYRSGSDDNDFVEIDFLGVFGDIEKTLPAADDIEEDMIFNSITVKDKISGLTYSDVQTWSEKNTGDILADWKTKKERNEGDTFANYLGKSKYTSDIDFQDYTLSLKLRLANVLGHNTKPDGKLYSDIDYASSTLYMGTYFANVLDTNTENLRKFDNDGIPLKTKLVARILSSRTLFPGITYGNIESIVTDKIPTSDVPGYGGDESEYNTTLHGRELFSKTLFIGKYFGRIFDVTTTKLIKPGTGEQGNQYSINLVGKMVEEATLPIKMFLFNINGEFNTFNFDDNAFEKINNSMIDEDVFVKYGLSNLEGVDFNKASADKIKIMYILAKDKKAPSLSMTALPDKQLVRPKDDIKLKNIKNIDSINLKSNNDTEIFNYSPGTIRGDERKSSAKFDCSEYSGINVEFYAKSWGMDTEDEIGHILWYTGSEWKVLESVYNKEGNYFVNVPDEWLSSENKIQIDIVNSPDHIIHSESNDYYDGLTVNNLKVTASKDISRIIVSTNKGSTWNYITDEGWKMLSNLDKETVYNKGMKISEFNRVSSENWNELVGDSETIRFAYLINKQSVTSNDSIDDLGIKIDLYGEWKKSTKENYDYSYNDGLLSVKLLSDGNYKINYQLIK